MAIGFYGVNILNPTKIDLSNAFVCDEEENLIGMNSTLKKWNKLIDDLHLGGASDYIEVSVPVSYSASNTLSWTDDSGENGEDVDDYVDCGAGTTAGTTACKVPVSMGFSAYTINIPIADSSPGSSNGGGGGSGATILANKSQNGTGSTANTSSGEDNDSKTQISPGEGTGNYINNIASKFKLKYVLLGIILIVVVVFGIWRILKNKRS